MLRRAMGRATMVAAAVCALLVLAPAAANAAYYNTYTTVATLGDGNDGSYTTDEGFAVGTTYTYSIKLDGSSGSRAEIYRTDMSDGTTTLMTYSINGNSQDYITGLGHANDIALMSNGGNYYMYVVTMATTGASLVKLQYVGTTYTEVGSYTITYGGAEKAMSGVKIIEKTASDADFLFKLGTSYYKGTLGLTAPSGTIAVTNIFNLDVADAPVDGATVSGIDTWASQGIGYSDGLLYHIVTNDNVSIVLVYQSVLDFYDDPQSPAPTLASDPTLSFRVTSSTYSALFEIEGVGVASGTLWFGANRATTSGGANHDCVCTFNGYVAS